MNIAPQSSYNLTEERHRKESPSEYVSHFMDVQHTEFVMSCAETMHMSVEDATAYALAMFNALQDLVYFHYDLELGDIEVTTIRTSISDGSITNVKDKNRIIKFREGLKEPYFTNRNKVVESSLRHLKGQSESEARLAGCTVKVSEIAKKSKVRIAKKKEADKKAAKKRSEKYKRMKKWKDKRWGWMSGA
jgi:hypothetical protein